MTICKECNGTGKKTWKHGESDHHSSGATTKCPACDGCGIAPTSIQPTIEDAKQYCPCNSKCRGDDQCPLCGDNFEEGACKLDGERCHPQSCSTLKQIVNYKGDCP